MSKSSFPSTLALASSASPSQHQRPKLLASHDLSIGISATRSMQDRARGALAKVRALCFRAARIGVRHDEIAEAIGVPARTLSSYKAGTTVPHVVVEALESFVMKVERDFHK
jgi:hypothetical protein